MYCYLKDFLEFRANSTHADTLIGEGLGKVLAGLFMSVLYGIGSVAGTGPCTLGMASLSSEYLVGVCGQYLSKSYLAFL